MLFFNEKDKALNVFFLKEEHLAMLKAKNIPFDALPYLLFTRAPKEDLLDIIAFQRSVENKYFGRKFTTYKTSGDLKFTQSDNRHDMDLLGPELEEVYNSSKYYDEPKFLSVYCVHNFIIIGFSGNSYLQTDFKASTLCPLKTLYQAVLENLGYHQTYFREPVRGNDASGIGLAELISVVLK